MALTSYSPKITSSIETLHYDQIGVQGVVASYWGRRRLQFPQPVNGGSLVGQSARPAACARPVGRDQHHSGVLGR